MAYNRIFAFQNPRPLVHGGPGASCAAISCYWLRRCIDLGAAGVTSANQMGDKVKVALAQVVGHMAEERLERRIDYIAGCFTLNIVQRIELEMLDGETLAAAVTAHVPETHFLLIAKGMAGISASHAMGVRKTPTYVELFEPNTRLWRFDTMAELANDLDNFIAERLITFAGAEALLCPVSH